MSKQDNRILRVIVQLLLLLAVVVVCSCSPYRKLIQSGDAELIYQTALEQYDLGEWKKASALLDRVSDYYIGTEREDSIVFYNARCSYKDQDFSGAVELLDEFRRTYGRSIFLEDAEGMLAMSYFYLSPAPSRDQNMTHVAIMAIDEFCSRYPQSEQIETFKEVKQELVNRLHEKSFTNAYTYFKIGKFKSAIVAFKSAMKEYPNSYLRESLSYYTLASAYELAHNSVFEKREDRYLSMIDSYYTFVAEFPESEHRSKADKMLKEARDYIEQQKRDRENKVVEERVIFWKRIFGKKQTNDEIEKVEI